MGALTCEDVDRVVVDLDVPRAPGDERTPRFRRHLYFARFVLGEPWPDAFAIADACRHTPLPLDAMRQVAAAWGARP